MDVLIVLAGHPTDIGGIERVVSHTMSRVATIDDVNCRIVCAAAEKTENPNPAIDCLSLSGIGPLFDFRFGRAFQRHLDRLPWEPDLVHFHLSQARGPLLFSRNRTLNARVVTYHTTAYGKQKKVYARTPTSELLPKQMVQKHAYGKIEPKVESFALPEQAYVTTVSEGIRTEVEAGYGTDVTRVVPNGIDTEIPTSTGDGNYLLFIGRLMPQKGLFRIPDILQRSEVDIPLKIVGDGPYLQRAERAYAAQNIDVDFLKQVSEERLHELYVEAVLLLLPSYYEGHPMVALEAARAGLPIVAFESANVQETVCPANADMIAADGDINDFAESISALVGDLGCAADIGAANHDRILDYYNASRMAADYVEVYRSVVG